MFPKLSGDLEDNCTKFKGRWIKNFWLYIYLIFKNILWMWPILCTALMEVIFCHDFMTSCILNSNLLINPETFLLNLEEKCIFLKTFPQDFLLIFRISKKILMMFFMTSLHCLLKPSQDWGQDWGQDWDDVSLFIRNEVYCLLDVCFLNW